MLKVAFSGNKHPRFMKELSSHDPCGRSRFYSKAVETSDLPASITPFQLACAAFVRYPSKA